MSDITDIQEDMQEYQPRLPSSNFGKARMIYRLRAHRFYWAVAFIYSLFLNLILIWEYKL